MNVHNNQKSSLKLENSTVIISSFVKDTDSKALRIGFISINLSSLDKGC